MRSATLQHPEFGKEQSLEKSGSVFYGVLAGFSALLLSGIYVFVHFIAKSW